MPREGYWQRIIRASQGIMRMSGSSLADAAFRTKE